MCGKRGVLAALAAGIVITVISLVVGMIVQSIWPYDIFTLGGMRAKDDPIMILFFLHPFVLAGAMTIVYAKLSGALSGDITQKGKKFGLLMWAVVSLPSIFLVYSSMNYPLGFHLSGLIGSLIYMPAAGITIAKLMK